MAGLPEPQPNDDPNDVDAEYKVPAPAPEPMISIGSMCVKGHVLGVQVSHGCHP